jgi:hypothetical protein
VESFILAEKRDSREEGGPRVILNMEVKRKFPVL